MSELPGQQALFGNPEPVPELNTEPTLKQLREQNKAAYARLMTDGALPNPISVLSMRLELLLDLVLSPDQRRLYNLAFETQMSKMLAELHQQVTAAKFTRGTDVPPSGGLLLPR